MIRFFSIASLSGHANFKYLANKNTENSLGLTLLVFKDLKFVSQQLGHPF